jgi:Tetratricopeptide repeat
MTMQEDLWGPRGSRGSWVGSAGRQPDDRAYFLDLLGDSYNGLGRHEAAIEAYRQAAERFRSQGAQCSYALCLFKIADSHLSLGEPWHALGYLEACLPLLGELGLTRHETLARHQLDACRAELTGAALLGEGRSGPRPLRVRRRPPPGYPPTRPAKTESLHSGDQGRFVLCPGPTDSRAG